MSNSLKQCWPLSHLISGSIAALLLVSTSSFADQTSIIWGQFGKDSVHSSASPISGQPINTTLSIDNYFPQFAKELADTVNIFGESVLAEHYQSPLVEVNNKGLTNV